jgi:hypothetical protein
MKNSYAVKLAAGITIDKLTFWKITNDKISYNFPAKSITISAKLLGGGRSKTKPHNQLAKIPIFP